MHIKQYVEQNAPGRLAKEDLAKKCGFSYSYLSQLCHGHKIVGIDGMAQIALATDGAITLKAMRPDIFKSKRVRDALIKSLK